MYKALISFILALGLSGAAWAADPALATDQDKTLYALGLAIANNLQNFNLTPTDVVGYFIMHAAATHLGSGVTVGLYANTGQGIDIGNPLVTGGAFTWTGNLSGTGLASAPLGVTNALTGGIAVNLVTFCLQLNQAVTSPDDFTITNLTNAPIPVKKGLYGGGLDPSPAPPVGTNMSDDTAQLLEWLWTDHIVEAFSSADLAAAFQLAVWKLEYDGRNTGVVDWSTGHIRASGTSGILATAAGWINSVSTLHAFDSALNAVLATNDTALINAAYTQAGLVHLAALTSQSGQDQITPYDTGTSPFVSVPEPGSMAVWGLLAFAGIAFSRRGKTA
jgi:hypothetical protein